MTRFTPAGVGLRLFIMPSPTWRQCISAALYAAGFSLCLLGCPASIAAGAIIGERAMEWVWAMVLPISVLIGVIAGIGTLRQRRMRDRIRANLCPACGYDLRASHDRCPECGRKIVLFDYRCPIRP